MKLLIVHDYEAYDERRADWLRWAYARRSLGIAKYAPEGVLVKRTSTSEVTNELCEWSDVIFLLDYMSIKNMFMRAPAKPLIVSFNKDSNSRQECWDDVAALATYVICNNRDRYDWAMKNGFKRVCCIDNGVDTDIFIPKVSPARRLTDVIWCGSDSPKKMKNYRAVLKPLEVVLDGNYITHDFRPLKHAMEPRILTEKQQVEWYNTGRIYLSVSSSEGGGPSSVLEAMSCGCALVTTNIGSVRTFGTPENCVIVEPTVESALAGIKEALGRIDALSHASIRLMGEWSYRNRAKSFYKVFTAIHRGESPAPFCWDDCGNQEAE